MGLISEEPFNENEETICKTDTIKSVEKRIYDINPGYLEKIKQEIDDEFNLIKEMKPPEQEDEEKSQGKFLLSESERKELILALKKNKELKLSICQSISAEENITTELKEKKETLEKEIDQLDKDIELLSKNFIFIDSKQ